MLTSVRSLQGQITPTSLPPQGRYVKIDPSYLQKKEVQGGAGPGMFDGCVQAMIIGGMIIGATMMAGAAIGIGIAQVHYPYAHPVALLPFGAVGALAAFGIMILLTRHVRW